MQHKSTLHIYIFFSSMFCTDWAVGSRHRWRDSDTECKRC